MVGDGKGSSQRYYAPVKYVTLKPRHESPPASSCPLQGAQTCRTKRVSFRLLFYVPEEARCKFLRRNARFLVLLSAVVGGHPLHSIVTTKLGDLACGGL